MPSPRRSWGQIAADANLDFDPRSLPEYQEAIWGPEVGALIRNARKEAGLNQSELATLTHMKQPNIARLEAGANVASIDTLARLANAFGQMLMVGMVSADDVREFELNELACRGQITFGLQAGAKSSDIPQAGMADHLFGESDEPPEWLRSAIERGDWRELVSTIAERAGQERPAEGTAIQGMADAVSAAVSKGAEIAAPRLARAAKTTRLRSKAVRAAKSARSRKRTV